MGLPTDIKLNPADVLLVSGDRCVVNAWDLELWGDGRSGTVVKSPKTFRRALVHWAGDSLAINFEGDYAGGIRLGGEVQIVASSNKSIQQAQTVLSQSGSAIYNSVQSVNLINELNYVRLAIASLELRIRNLEKKSP